MEEEAIEELMKLSYEEWAHLAAKQCEAQGEVPESMMEVAVKKGDWLNRWYSKEGVSGEVKQAKKRGRMNTVGDLLKCESNSEPGAEEWVKTGTEDYGMPQAADEEPAQQSSCGPAKPDEPVLPPTAPTPPRPPARRSEAVAAHREAKTAENNTSSEEAIRAAREKMAAHAASLRPPQRQKEESDSRMTDSRVEPWEELKDMVYRVKHTAAKTAEIVIKTEGYRNLLTVVKRKGTTNANFHQNVWPLMERTLKPITTVVEYKARHGLAKIFSRTDADSKQTQAALSDVLKREGKDEQCSVFVGKGDLERAQDEQMHNAYICITEGFQWQTKAKREEVGLITGWPDSNGSWYYALAPHGTVTRVLAAGKNDIEEMEAKVWILEGWLYEEYIAKDEATQQKFLLQTAMQEVETEADMMLHARATKIEREAGGGKGKTGGKSKGGKGKGAKEGKAGGGKKGGGKVSGKKHPGHQPASASSDYW